MDIAFGTKSFRKLAWMEKKVCRDDGCSVSVRLGAAVCMLVGSHKNFELYGK